MVQIVAHDTDDVEAQRALDDAAAADGADELGLVGSLTSKMSIPPVPLSYA